MDDSLFSNIYFIITVAIFIFVAHALFKYWLNKRWAKNPDIPISNGRGRDLTLGTVNYIGFTFTGKFRHAEINGKDSYVTFYSFSIIGIPLFIFKCYRVIPAGEDGYYILGSERIDAFEVLCMILSTWKWAALIYAIIKIISSCSGQN